MTLVIFLFIFKDRKEDKYKENERKIDWLKSLVLDHNLKDFYEFFDNIEIELNKLKQNGLNDEEKGGIDEKIAEQFIFLRRKFIDILLAVDNKLYRLFISLSDELQEHITIAIFNHGINLHVQEKFDEVITEKLMETKTKFIQGLFTYRG